MTKRMTYQEISARGGKSKGLRQVEAVSALMLLIIGATYKDLPSNLDGIVDLLEGELPWMRNKIDAGDIYRAKRSPEHLEAVEGLIESKAKELLNEYRSSNDVPQDAIDLLRKTLSAYRSNEDPGHKLDGYVDALRGDYGQLQSIYTTAPKDIGIDDTLDELRHVTKKLGGKGMFVPTDVLKKARGMDNIVSRYKKLRRMATDAKDTVIRHAVRTNGTPHKIGDKTVHLVDASHIRKVLEKHGLPGAPHPDFVGKFNEDGESHTSDGVKLVGGPPASATEVKMNPDFDELSPGKAWYARYMPAGAVEDKNGKKHWKPVFTVNFKDARGSWRDEKAGKIAQKAKSARPKWIADLKNAKYDADAGVYAAMCELLYIYGIRAGSAGNEARDMETFGLTTLQMKHIRILGDRVRLAYAGKDAIQQQHDIKPIDAGSKVLKAYLSERYDEMKAAGAKNTDLFFSHHKGNRWTTIRRADLAGYFTHLGLPGISPKDFRRMRGTELFREELEAKNLPQDIDAGKLDKTIKQIALSVGEHLGHRRIKDGEQMATGATALKNYIAPSIMLEAFTSRGLRPSVWLQKLARAK